MHLRQLPRVASGCKSDTSWPTMTSAASACFVELHLVLNGTGSTTALRQTTCEQSIWTWEYSGGPGPMHAATIPDGPEGTCLHRHTLHRRYNISATGTSGSGMSLVSS